MIMQTSEPPRSLRSLPLAELASLVPSKLARASLEPRHFSPPEGARSGLGRPGAGPGGAS